MVSNGTPSSWHDRAKAQRPRTIVTSQLVEDRPAVRYEDLELHVDDEEPTRLENGASLLLVFAILGILLLLSFAGPDIFRFFREWWLG